MPVSLSKVQGGYYTNRELFCAQTAQLANVCVGVELDLLLLACFFNQWLQRRSLGLTRDESDQSLGRRVSCIPID
jgi:hypothetical protein